jgi:hypothetical protein
LDELNKKLADLEYPTHDKINNVIEEFAVKPDHVPLKYTLFGDKLDIIERFS